MATDPPSRLAPLKNALMPGSHHKRECKLAGLIAPFAIVTRKYFNGRNKWGSCLFRPFSLSMYPSWRRIDV
jgi:hypothetical protein